MAEGNGYATREAFLGAAPRRFKVVENEGFGKVRIQSLTELERSQFEASIMDKKGGVSATKLVDMKCRLIVLAVVDGEGNRILTNADISQIKSQDSKNTNKLVDDIREHCGFSDTDFEDLEKNCGATADASSQ